MRLVIATQEGIVTDRDDVIVARLGHAHGARIFEPSGEACYERYENCGLEWRASDGSMGEIAGIEMLVQQGEDGVLAVACIDKGGSRHEERDVLLLSEHMELSQGDSDRTTDVEASDRKPQRKIGGWWGGFFARKRKERQFFSVRDDLPREFLPIS